MRTKKAQAGYPGIWPGLETLNPIVNPKKLATGLRPNSAGIPYTLLLKIEAFGVPTFGFYFEP